MTIPSFGVIRCQTKAATLASAILKAKVGTATLTCTTGNCAYSTSTSLPAVTLATV